MNIGLTGRVTAAMVALAITTAAVVACVAYVNLERAAIPAGLGRLNIHVRALGGELEHYVDGARIGLLGLLGSPPFDGYARSLSGDGVDPYTDVTVEGWRDRIVDIFVERLENDPELDQLRLIAVQEPGMELIRVDRAGSGGAIRVVAPAELQAKGHRDYVEAARDLDVGEVYVSSIDLNREFGEIDPRRVPVLRVVTPLHDAHGRAFALAVANVDMTPVLDRMRQSTIDEGAVYVRNDLGTFLVHPDREIEHSLDQSRADASLEQLLANPDHDARVVRLHGSRVGLASFVVRPAGGPPVTVFAAVPYESLVGPIATLGRSTLIGSLVASALAVLIAILFARTLILPLVQMTRAVAAASDDGTGLRAPVGAAGEIGVLARAFETMKAEVGAKRRALSREVQERRQAEQRFRMVVESSPNGTLLVNAAGVITLANAEACRLFGWPREELEGAAVEVLVPERTRQHHIGLRHDYLQAPTSRSLGQGRDLYAIRRDGTQFPVEVALNPVEGAPGIEVLVVVADITSRKAAELQMQRHQQQLERLLAANPDAMLVVAEGLIVRLANDAALRMFSSTAEQLVGNRLDIELPLDGTAELEIPGGEGPMKVSVQVVPFTWDGESAYLASMRDVTRERRLGDQLRQVQKMEAVGRLAGGVAHDFNNLLTVIIGYASELRDRPDDERRIAHVKQILAAAERASSLSRQLLLHSRSSPVAPEPLSLSKVVASMEPMLRRVIGDDVDVSVTLTPDAWPVLADSGQIEQVVLNLVVNARDAMPDGGHLVIETSNLTVTDEYAATFVDVQAGDYVLLQISDTGCGMDHATQQRIFEPFFTTKSADKGTGLGLATSYGVIKQGGGHINVYSEIGVGSAFKIYLPRCVAVIAEAPAAGRQLVPLAGGGTVLVVEDDAGVRALARRALEAGGFEVLEADNGSAALGVVEQSAQGVDLLLTDMVMPGMGGVELAAQIGSRFPGVSVLYMSGYTGDTVIRAARLPPRASYIEKPFSPAELTERVRQILSDNRGSEEPPSGSVPPS